MTALERDLPVTIVTLEEFIDTPGHSKLDAFVECKEGQLCDERGDETRRNKQRRLWLREMVDQLRNYFPNVPLMAPIYSLDYEK